MRNRSRLRKKTVREYLSGRELARRLGVSETAVRKAVADGRLSPAKLDERGRKLFDEDLARNQWHVKTLPQTDTCLPKVGAPAEPPPDPVCELAFGKKLGPADARAARDASTAEINILKLKRMKRELVPAEDVARLWEKHAAEAKRLLLSLPMELRLHIPALNADNIQLIEDRLIGILDTLSAWNPKESHG